MMATISPHGDSNDQCLKVNWVESVENLSDHVPQSCNSTLIYYIDTLMQVDTESVTKIQLTL